MKGSVRPIWCLNPIEFVQREFSNSNLQRANPIGFVKCVWGPRPIRTCCGRRNMLENRVGRIKPHLCPRDKTFFCLKAQQENARGSLCVFSRRWAFAVAAAHSFNHPTNQSNQTSRPTDQSTNQHLQTNQQKQITQAAKQSINKWPHTTTNHTKPTNQPINQPAN